MTTQQKPEQWQDNPFHSGDRIRKARELAGYATLSAFADALGIDRGSLSKYEDGAPVKRSVLAAVHLATPVRIEWLETGTGEVFKTDAEASTKDYGSDDSELSESVAPVDLLSFRSGRSRA